jgi:hypothetical protein
MRLTFSGEVILWRGPAPHHFVALPDEDSEELAAQPELSYGWGCIPVQVTVGETIFETSLMPHEGRYLVPLKVAVRRAEAIDLGDVVTISLEVAE